MIVMDIQELWSFGIALTHDFEVLDWGSVEQW
jgi:hypothetical protein